MGLRWANLCGFGGAPGGTRTPSLVPLHGSLWARRLLRPSPGVGGVKFERRCQPSRQRAQRPGLNLLSPGPFLALGQSGEGGEELGERRIRVSQVPLDCAQGPPMAPSQIHRDSHELKQAGQNHSTSRRDRRPARGAPFEASLLAVTVHPLRCQAACARLIVPAGERGAGHGPPRCVSVPVMPGGTALPWSISCASSALAARAPSSSTPEPAAREMTSPPRPRSTYAKPTAIRRSCRPGRTSSGRGNWPS